nr:glycoside hydrolase family 5 protein [uncultured Albidiferax sp.]
MKKLYFLVAFGFLANIIPAQASSRNDLMFRGINLGAAAIAAKIQPGLHGTNYLWPTAAEVSLFASAGFNTLRVPFLWERMQPVLNMPFNEAELARLDAVVAAATANRVTIVLDPHNYGTYRQEIIGSTNVPISAFEDFWSRLAVRYKDMQFVAFGLMNEPHLQKAAEWAPIAQAALYAIRKTGATQLILVPGTRYSGAYSWLGKDGALSNAEALQGLQDPANNFVFEMHQYFDSNSSGTSPACVSEDIGVKRLEGVTAWLRSTGNKAFLGEFGASQEPTCLKALENTLTFMEQNKDVWQGWTYWVSAKWLGGYIFNIYPPDSTLFPQMKVIESFLPQAPKR